MTTQEFKFDLKRKIANAILGDIAKNCQDRNRGLASALDGYHAILEILVSCKIGMRTEYAGPNIIGLTLFDLESGDDLMIADAVKERR